jgi:hypothetical protein
MIRELLIATLAFAGLSSPAMASNGACAEFELLGTDGEFDYNPFRPPGVEKQLVLRVSRLDPSVTRVRFLLADVTPDGNFPKIGPFGVREYDIVARDRGRDDGDMLVWGPQPVNGTNGRDVIFNGSRRNDEIEHLTLRIPAGQPATGTNQEERLEVRYECYAGNDRIGAAREQRDSRVRLLMNTPRFFGAYVGTEGRSRGEVDLGSLSPSSGLVAKSAVVTAVSTVPYNVAISNSATGELKGAPEAPGLPYSITFDGLSVRNGSRLRCSATPAPDGAWHRLEFSVDGLQTRPLPAGRYRDTVTLTFSALDTSQSGPCVLTVS